MAEYQYFAKDPSGRVVQAVLDVPSVSDVVARLKTNGLMPLKVYERKAEPGVLQQIARRLRPKSISDKERMIFTRQLAAMLTTGLLLTEALETIAEDMDNEYLRGIINQTIADIRGGSDLSKSLSQYPKVFPVTYTAIVRSGEATGRLDKTLTNLARYLESSERLKEKVKSAVRYPLFVAGFAMMVVVVMVFFLIPKFEGIFSQAGAQLPLLTRIVVSISRFCMHNLIIIVLGISAVVGAFWYSLKFPKFRFCVDKAILKIPILGKEILEKALISRFCRTLGFLLSGGVGLTKAFEITQQVLNHLPLKEAVERIRLRVISGEAISDEIKDHHKIFPPLVAKMASIGERTGRLDEMFNKTADYYDEELEFSLQNLTSMLEPALIVFVGGIVLIVVLALYLPIFKMSSAIR